MPLLELWPNRVPELLRALGDSRSEVEMGGGIEGHWAPRREEIGTRSPADLSSAGVPLLDGSAGPDQS